MKYVCTTFVQNFPLSHTSPSEKEKKKKMNKKCPPPPYIKETSKELMIISCQRKRVKINSQNLYLAREQNQSACFFIGT